ncbi:MAG: DUF1428 domain-containing protein [Opitutaceae bacterium]
MAGGGSTILLLQRTGVRQAGIAPIRAAENLRDRTKTALRGVETEIGVRTSAPEDTSAPAIRIQDITMPRYVDGFVIPLPRRKLTAYRRMAETAREVWREHGALDYKECIGEDLAVKFGMTFSKRLELKRGETVVFSWILFKSRAHRDKVNTAVMKDSRIAELCAPKDMPFDVSRMLYGGFEVLVDF